MVKGYQSLVKQYFKENPFVEANIQSFNDFVERRLQILVDEVGDISPTIIPQEVESFVIKLKKIWIEKPTITEADGSKRDIFPSEARLRMLTYSAPMFLEVSAYVDDVQRENFVTMIGKLPIMLRSKYCHLHGLKREELISKGEDPDDVGGYFMINGNERVLVNVEDLASNRIFIEKKDIGPSEYVARVFSEMGSYRIPHTIEQMKDGIFYLTFTRFKRVPLIPVLKALGMTKDQEIVKMICAEKNYDSIFINLYDSAEIKTEDDALEYLSKRAGISQPKEAKFERTKDQLDRYLLPHLGTQSKDRILKAYNLCKMVRKFLQASSDGLPLPDKDHYANKRLKLSGDLLEDLIRTNLRSLVQDILYNFQRLVKRGKFQSIKIIIRDELLTSNIKSSLATGTWTGGRKGVSQNIDRTNMLATYSHLQRIVSLLTSTQENFEARALHPTHWGRLCLKKDTNILLADRYSNRSLEMLQNCWNHHKVLTFDAKETDFKTSTISKYFTSNPKLMGKKVYKLTVESGREIVATEDHPFYTKSGWVDASGLYEGNYVAVYPTLDPIDLPSLPTDELGEEIVNENDIKINYPKRFKHYIKELHSSELLPFTINNYKIEIIARLLGHIFSDGHCGKNNLEFYCGTRRDAEVIAEDIRLLGFEPSKISEKHTKIKLIDRVTNYRTFVLTKGGALHSLLVCAGAPVGKKTDLEVNIPRWLFKSSLAVKREFLAALLGGDGPKPAISIRKDRKSGSKLRIDPMTFHKKSELKENIIKFSKDIKKLFGEFGVEIKKINIEEDYERKDGAKMLKCKINFSYTLSNKKKLLNIIGYRYCIDKEVMSSLAGEWLRLRDFAIAKRNKIKNKVKEFYINGMPPRKISNLLGINYRVVNGWLFSFQRYNKTRLSQRMVPPFEKWVESSRIGKLCSVWEKIVSKKEEDLDDVRDFTTAEDTHSFIANGFITHNCPIETPEGTSIGLRKNIAILCAASKGDAQEEKVKKTLENLGMRTKT